VNLKVKIGGSANSRALSDTLAKGSANYIEVIFKSGTDYYQADGLRDQVLSLKLPADNYTSANSILLVGKKGSKSGADFYTLLAVGTPSAGGNLTSLPAGTNTAEITFTVTSLTADLYAGGTPTFAITNVFTTSHPDFVGKTADGTFHEDLTTCFQVPTGMTSADPITAKLEISGFGATTTGATGTIVSNGTNAVIFTEVGPTTGNPITVAPAGITFGIGTGADVGKGTIGFSFETGSNKANYVITFDIPVAGLSAAISNALTWHICGGTDLAPTNYQSATGSAKEGVALLVTSSPYKLVNISVNPSW